MNFKLNKSLLARYILSFWSILAIIMVMVVVFFRGLLLSNMEEFNDQLHMEMLMNGVQSVQREVEHVRDMLDQLRMTKDVNPLYIMRHSAYLRTAQQEMKQIFLTNEVAQECILVSPAGDFALSNTTSYRPEYLLKRLNHPAFSECTNFADVVQVIQEQRFLTIQSDGKQYIVYGVPYAYMGVTDSSYLIVLLDASQLLDRFAAYVSAEQKAQAAIYYDGRPIVSSLEPAVPYADIEGKTTFYYQNSEFRVLQHTEDNAISFVYLTDDSIYRAPLTKAVGQFLLALGGIFLVGSFLIVLMARYNYRPVSALQGSIEEYLHRKRTKENELLFISEGINQIIKENSHLNDRLQLEQKQLKNFCLFKLVNGVLADEDTIHENLDSIDIHFKKDSFLCMSMALRDPVSIEPFSAQIEQDRISEVKLCSLHYLINGANVVLIFNYDQQHEEYIRNLLYNFIHCYAQIFPMSVGIGEPAREVENISRSYNQSVIALRYAESGEAQDVLEYGKIHFSNSIEKIYNNTQVNELLAAIKKNDQQAINCVLADVRSMIQQNKLPGYAIKALYYQIVNAVLATSRNPALYEKGNEILLIIGEAVQKYSVEELQAQIENLCSELVSQTHDVVQMDEILSYIQQHCCEMNFSIANMADEFDMTYQQMNSLFKKEMNMTVIDYVSERKISTAIELLKATNLTVAEIVKQTGYVDNSSFTRKFKQATGMTPSEYRRTFSEDI